MTRRSLLRSRSPRLPSQFSSSSCARGCLMPLLPHGRFLFKQVRRINISPFDSNCRGFFPSHRAHFIYASRCVFVKSIVCIDLWVYATIATLSLWKQSIKISPGSRLIVRISPSLPRRKTPSAIPLPRSPSIQSQSRRLKRRKRSNIWTC